MFSLHFSDYSLSDTEQFSKRLFVYDINSILQFKQLIRMKLAVQESET